MKTKVTWEISQKPRHGRPVVVSVENTDGVIYSLVAVWDIEKMAWIEVCSGVEVVNENQAVKAWCELPDLDANC